MFGDLVFWGLKSPPVRKKIPLWRNFGCGRLFEEVTSPLSVMEPFDPQDPLTKLLAQARRIEARSNFTQNVLREARQTPQDRGWFAALRAWWEEGSSSAPVGRWAFAGGVAAALVLTVAVLQMQPDASSAPQVAGKSATPAVAAPVVAVVEVPVLPDMPAAESAWETAYQTEELLAVEDTSQFTDSEIGFLLY